MSHITKIKAKISSLDDLKAAVEKMGLVFRENKSHYNWYRGNSNQNKCDHAIGLKNANAYEIGVTKEGDEYRLAFDNFDRSLSSIVGNNCEKLTNEYTKVMALNQAVSFCQMNNYSFTEYTDPVTGKYKIEMEGY